MACHRAPPVRDRSAAALPSNAAPASAMGQPQWASGRRWKVSGSFSARVPPLETSGLSIVASCGMLGPWRGRVQSLWPREAHSVEGLPDVRNLGQLGIATFDGALT